MCRIIFGLFLTGRLRHAPARVSSIRPDTILAQSLYLVRALLGGQHTVLLTGDALFNQDMVKFEIIRFFVILLLLCFLKSGAHRFGSSPVMAAMIISGSCW